MSIHDIYGQMFSVKSEINVFFPRFMSLVIDCIRCDMRNENDDGHVIRLSQ